MSKWKNLIFDLDGTLIDTDLYVVINYLHLFEMYRPDSIPSLRELSSFSGPPLTEIFATYFPLIAQEELLAEFKLFQIEYSKKYSSLYEKEIIILDKFKAEGYNMSIVTSKRKYATEMNLQDFQLDKYFSTIVALEDTSRAKPYPDGIILALDKIGAIQSESVYIGDNYSDMLAGIAAGIDVILVDFGIRRVVDDQRISYRVASFEELYEVIQNE